MGRHSSNSREVLEERSVLICKYLGMVREIARRMSVKMGAVHQREDLISWGTLGLIEAADVYDGSLNVKFGAFARFRIKGAILDALRHERKFSRWHLLDFDTQDSTKTVRFNSEGPSPEYLLHTKKMRFCLLGLIETLSSVEQMIVALHYYEGMSLKETSNVLSISESRVSQIHSKLLKQLNRRAVALCGRKDHIDERRKNVV